MRSAAVLLTLIAAAGHATEATAPAGPDGLARAVDQAMSGRQGCAVVLDVESGRLLAQHRLDLAARRLVPPGSTLKPFTLLALLDSGIVRADSRLACGHELRIAGRRMDCTHPATAEPLDAAAALAYSCNNYFAHFAGMLPDGRLVRVFERAGLATRTGLAASEVAGHIRPSHGLEDQLLQALGEARIEVTPLGLAEAYRRLALRRGESGSDRMELTPIFAGLEASVSFGMGRAAAPDRVTVAGKTGTAAAVEGPWTHAWFAGYAPADRPEIVVVVFLERGRGGADAAPIARQIFSAWAAAALTPSEPPDVKVRLDWLRPPSRIEIAPSGSGAWLAARPRGRPEPLAVTIRLTAEGGRTRIERVKTNRVSADHGRDGEDTGRASGVARSWGASETVDGVEISGEFALKGVSEEPLHLGLPLGITADEGRLLLTARMPLEDYVAAVLAGESGGFTSDEGLAAMAVAARTFAARFRGRHRAEGFDYCDTTHCQDLRLTALSDRMRRAAQRTVGELLWWEGEPAAAYYHADCGGESEEAQLVWPGPRLPYLRRIEDPYCTDRGRRGWSTEIGADEMQRALAVAGLGVRGALRAIEVEDRTPSGRARIVRLKGSSDVVVPASQFRFLIGRTLGWDRIRSDLYDVRRAGDLFLFHGYGSGHGVGLCQAGADRMGQEGWSHRDILAHYYPGTWLGLEAAGLAWETLGGERVDLLSTRPADDRPLAALADRLLREAEGRSGWRLSSRPRIAVYPSVASFRNATGEPGWVAASTRTGVIRLQPPTTLRARRALESTLRHEILHLLVEAHVDRATPLWYREGIVLHLAGAPRDPRQGSRPPGAAPRGAGPLDSDALDRALRRPAGSDEMRRAYAEAQARVEALVAAHGEAQILAWAESGGPPERPAKGPGLPDRRSDDGGRLGGPAGAPDDRREDQPGGDRQ